MTKLKAFILAGLVAATALFAPAPARAVALECDTLSTGLGVCLPRYGTDFDQWAASDIAALTLINAGAASTTTVAALGASTTSITTALNALAVSTTALSASTTSLKGILNTVGASTAALSASTSSISSILTSVGASTATLSLSTASIYSALQSTAGALTAETAARIAADLTLQPLDADLTDLADGSLTGSKVGSGVPAANIANGTMGTVNTGGNAATATALAANGSNCSSGSSPLGVDASGASESCFDVATQAELDTHAALTGTSAHSAASANTASMIVARDGSGNFSAGTITGALSGNATTATSLASGGVGQVPYQTGSGATSFLPAMAAGGIITGNGTSAIPSTGTFTGTANQVVITRTGANIVLSTPQDIGTGSSPTFNTVTAALSGNATTATTATNIASGAAGQILYQSASGTTAKLPAMADGGIVIGAGTSVAPTTGTLTGTANQVVVTRNGAGVVLSGPQSLGTGSSPTFVTVTAALSGNSTTATALAANGANCSAGQAPLGVDASGAVESCTAYQAADADLDDLADGSLSGSKIGSGIVVSNLAAGALPENVTVSTANITPGTNGAGQLVKLDASSKLPAVDGSALINLPSAAGGAVLASTQTFSGINTFNGGIISSSYVVAGMTTLTSTATYTSLYQNAYTMVASTNPSSLGLSCIYGISAGYNYELEFTLTQIGSNGKLEARFNGDSGSTYDYRAHYNVGSEGLFGNTAQTLLELSGPILNTAAYEWTGRMRFALWRADSTQITMYGETTVGLGTSGDGFGHIDFSGHYDGASSIASICVFPSAGTLTGRINLYALKRGDQ